MKNKLLILVSLFIFIILISSLIFQIYTNKYFDRIDKVYNTSHEMLKSGKQINTKLRTYPEEQIYEYFYKLSLDLKKVDSLSFDNYKKEYLNSSFYKDIVASKNNVISYFENEKSNIELLKEKSNKEEFIKYLTDNNVNKSAISYLNTTIDDKFFETSYLDDKLYLEKERFNRLIMYTNYLSNEKETWIYESDNIVSTNGNLVDDINKRNNEYGIDLKAIKGDVNKVENNIDKSKRIPVLMYHGVSDETWGIANLFIKISDFEDQMKYISNNFETIFIEDIEKDYSNKKVISLTFDDAYVDFYTNVFPILKKYNLKANLYVIVNARGGKYLDDNQIKEISSSGLVSIGSHTLNHLSLKNLSDEEINNELKDSKKELESLINKEVKTICYPSGSYDSNVMYITSKYYDYGLAIRNDTERMNNTFNKYAIKRYRMYRNTSFDSFKEKVNMAN